MSTASLLPIVTDDPALAADKEELYDALEDLLSVYPQTLFPTDSCK